MSKGNVEFKLDINGLRQLMKSEEMQAVLEECGQATANRAGRDYGTRVHTASFVAIANVYPESGKAARDVFKNNTLLKALGAVGLRMSK